MSPVVREASASPPKILGSCGQISSDFYSQQCPQEFLRHLLDVITPFKNPYVLVNGAFAHSPEDPEEIPNTGPDPFHRVVVDLPDPITIIISCPLPLARCVTHGHASIYGRRRKV